MGRLNKLEVLELHSSSSHFTKLNYRGLSKRKTTETWLKGLAKERGYKFRHFLTLSFYKPQQWVINQYLDNEHIKKSSLTSSTPTRNQKTEYDFGYSLSNTKTETFTFTSSWKGWMRWSG